MTEKGGFSLTANGKIAALILVGFGTVFLFAMIGERALELLLPERYSLKMATSGEIRELIDEVRILNRELTYRQDEFEVFKRIIRSECLYPTDEHRGGGTDFSPYVDMEAAGDGGECGRKRARSRRRLVSSGITATPLPTSFDSLANPSPPQAVMLQLPACLNEQCSGATTTERAGDGGVVDVAEDGRALISGVSVAGGLGTADGCGDNEVVTVQISARSGRVGSVGNFVGVVVDRVGSALRLRGPRKAVQGVLDSSLPSVATS